MSPFRVIPFAPAALAAVLCAATARAQLIRDELPEIAQGVEVRERLGEQLPADLQLINDQNQPVLLGDYFNNDKPIILLMVYYRCPMVCTLVLDRLKTCVEDLDYDVGEDYDVVVISFDHTETASAAAEEKASALARYGRPITDATRRGYAFHVTDELTALELSKATGFSYRRLKNGEYSHPVALMILTPDGRIGRYVYGMEYPAKRVKLALLEASKGKIAASIGDYFLHLCFRYDPNAGVYSVQAMAVVRLAGALTILFLTVLIGGLILRDRTRRGKRHSAAAASPASAIATGQA